MRLVRQGSKESLVLESLEHQVLQVQQGQLVLQVRSGQLVAQATRATQALLESRALLALPEVQVVRVSRAVLEQPVARAR